MFCSIWQLENIFCINIATLLQKKTVILQVYSKFLGNIYVSSKYRGRIKDAPLWESILIIKN